MKLCRSTCRRRQARRLPRNYGRVFRAFLYLRSSAATRVSNWGGVTAALVTAALGWLGRLAWSWFASRNRFLIVSARTKLLMPRVGTVPGWSMRLSHIRLACLSGRAAQYVRMSTDHQQYSIANQLAVIAAYAQRFDLEIFRTYRDDGKSGLHIKGRAGLLDLIDDVQCARADFGCILVFDVSSGGDFRTWAVLSEHLD